MHRHTPDKARLMEKLPEGNRRAALDVLSEIRPKNASIVNRVSAWKQLSINLAQRPGTQLNRSSAARMRIVLIKMSQSEHLASSKKCPYCMHPHLKAAEETVHRSSSGAGAQITIIAYLLSGPCDYVRRPTMG